jgi:AcrR family transcriptional regulator
MDQAGLEFRKRPSQERSRELVEWIVEAAARVVQRDGYEGLTTNHIAEEAGVSIGSVYQYFPTKDAILAELTRRHVEEGMGAFREIFVLWRTDPPSDLALAVRSLVQLSVDVNSPARLHEALYERSAVNAAAALAEASFHAELVTGVTALVKRFAVCGEHPSRAAELLVSSTWATVHEVILAQDTDELRASAIDEWVRFVTAGLSLRPETQVVE